MPNVIDLYSGAGGLSLGASRAGFNVIAAVDVDRHANMTHKINFPYTAHIEKDALQLSVEEIEKATGIIRSNILGVIGGPPCQGFSSIGQGDVADKRNILFKRFFEIVKEIRPVFFVVENVPGIMRIKYNEFREDAMKLVDDSYNMIDPFLANASEFGAATVRTRYFFIGVRKDCKLLLSADDFNKAKVQANMRTKVSDALEGLPLNMKFAKDQTGIASVENSYFAEDKSRHQNEFFFSRMTDKIPIRTGNLSFITRYQEKHITNGFLMTNHTEAVIERFKNLKYGEQDKISKSYKLNPESFCPTIRAGTGPDKGSFQAVRPIHFSEPRVINPREAARLQGFPDWFVLPDTIWHSFRQIGNSVSPIVAEAIMRVIYEHLN